MVPEAQLTDVHTQFERPPNEFTRLGLQVRQDLLPFSKCLARLATTLVQLRICAKCSNRRAWENLEYRRCVC